MPSTLNTTVPVAVAGLTVAVKVTFCPGPDGLGLLVKVVVVATLFTTWVSEPLPPPL